MHWIKLTESTEASSSIGASATSWAGSARLSFGCCESSSTLNVKVAEVLFGIGSSFNFLRSLFGDSVPEIPAWWCMMMISILMELATILLQVESLVDSIFQGSCYQSAMIQGLIIEHSSLFVSKSDWIGFVSATVCYEVVGRDSRNALWSWNLCQKFRFSVIQ